MVETTSPAGRALAMALPHAPLGQPVPVQRRGVDVAHAARQRATDNVRDGVGVADRLQEVAKDGGSQSDAGCEEIGAADPHRCRILWIMNLALRRLLVILLIIYRRPVLSSQIQAREAQRLTMPHNECRRSAPRIRLVGSRKLGADHRDPKSALLRVNGICLT